VTDRRQFSGSPDQLKIFLIEKIRQAALAGVEWIQIREKDLPASELSELARDVIRSVPATCRVLINDRLDVACAVGAGGVHLGEKSITVQEAKRFALERNFSDQFLIGASVHSLQAAQDAERDGADYIVFGPVFATPSKKGFGSPQGLQCLTAVCRGVSIPVLGIGGITPENVGDCYASGANGIAAIRVFQEAAGLSALVKQLRAT
jgi:thiamine-phosphate pyrophosphorylase